MADPRTFTVKQCEPAYGKKSGASISSATTSRKNFFSGIGKIGDLEVLNSVGGGGVGRGLRTLASISNSIRVGSGALPSSIGTSLDTGANWVLEQTGITPGTVDALRTFNPGIANQGFSQAKNVFQKVKSGSFKTRDIPGVLQDFQNLERLGRGIFTPGRGDGQTTLGERCEASPYAIDLVGRAPKHKFMFIVQFVPAPGYGPLGGQDFGPFDMAFTVKTSTRPNMKFHTEDVNYYNFRTKVITKTEFEPMTMTFHDDIVNVATQFYKAYMRAISPITGIEESGAQSDMLEQGGMDFVGNTLKENEIVGAIGASTYAASSGPLFKDNKEIFKEIRLYHLYDSGNMMNVWRFFNPKINAMTLDDLDMSVGNEGSQISITFDYDTVFLDAEVNLKLDKKYNLLQAQRGAVYPLRYNGPRDGNANTTLKPATKGGGNDLKTLTTKTLASAKNAVISAASNLSSKYSNPYGRIPTAPPIPQGDEGE